MASTIAPIAAPSCPAPADPHDRRTWSPPERRRALRRVHDDALARSHSAGPRCSGEARSSGCSKTPARRSTATPGLALSARGVVRAALDRGAGAASPSADATPRVTQALPLVIGAGRCCWRRRGSPPACSTSTTGARRTGDRPRRDRRLPSGRRARPRSAAVWAPPSHSAGGPRRLRLSPGAPSVPGRQRPSTDPRRPRRRRPTAAAACEAAAIVAG